MRYKNTTKIGMLGNRVVTADTRTSLSAPKTSDPVLHTPDHKAWREDVLKRAGYRCEAIDNGVRCPKAAPQHRLFADHIVERQDGGALYDRANGQCLCGHHHSTKTADERAKRMAKRTLA